LWRFEETVDQQFTIKMAGEELERYRRKGAGRTARLLIEGGLPMFLFAVPMTKRTSDDLNA
jgi:hypothetical protein